MGPRFGRPIKIAVPLSLVLLTALVVPAAQSAIGYARPKSATPIFTPLVVGYISCSAGRPATRVHAPPLSNGSCNPAIQSSSYLTVGTPDANGAAANSTGFVRFRIFYCPMCASPINEDVFVTAELTDVRNKGDLSDYAGELQAIVTARITDIANGPSQTEPATVEDTKIDFAVPCAATADDSIGGSCAVATRLNSILPGAVIQDARAIWELDQVRVLDGGKSGVAGAPDATLFADQGLFAP